MRIHVLFKGFIALVLCVIAGISNAVTRPYLPDTLGNERQKNAVEFDFIPDHNYNHVADRLSCMEGEIPLTFNTKVYSFINYFAVRNREYTHGILSRKEIYFPVIEEYLQKYGLPDELKYLAIVESGFNPRAISRAGAGGLWQFMPYTGRSYGLHQDFYIDERFDPHKSTDAACKYIKMMYNMFGDWELALAAYNSGPGNVRKAIRRSGYKKGFWEIYRYLPRETRSYVPQFVAIQYVMQYAHEYNFIIKDKIYPMEYDTLMVDEFINLKLLANELNICYEDLEMLNPAIKRFALPDAIKKYPVNIPIDKIAFIRKNREEILTNSALTGKNELQALARNTPGSTYGRARIVHRVRSGDVLGTIAQRYHVRISDIRKWNHIRGNLIRIGQRLNIWVLPGRHTNYTAGHVATTKKIKPDAPASGKITKGKIYYVQPGDTLWDISRKYEGLSIEKIKKLNNLTSSRITPGQTLIIGE